MHTRALNPWHTGQIPQWKETHPSNAWAPALPATPVEWEAAYLLPQMLAVVVSQPAHPSTAFTHRSQPHVR